MGQIRLFEKAFNSKFKVRNPASFELHNIRCAELVGFRTRPPPPTLTHRSLAQAKASIFAIPPTDSPIGDAHWLQRPFARQELNYVFSKVRRHKAVGPDGIDNQMLLEGFSVYAEILLRIYNLSWHCEYTPKLWRVSNYVPLLKPGRDDDNPDNYRPLQVSSQLARMLAALVSNRLLSYCAHEPNRPKLKYWNMAFQPNKAIDDLLAALVGDAYYARAHDTNMNIVATDITGCYDSIHLESLMVKLHDVFGLNGRILNWIYKNLSERWTRVVVNHSFGNIVEWQK